MQAEGASRANLRPRAQVLGGGGGAGSEGRVALVGANFKRPTHLSSVSKLGAELAQMHLHPRCSVQAAAAANLKRSQPFN